MTTKAKELQTLAYLSCRLARPVSHVRKLLEQLGIAPAVYVNGKAHYTDADEVRLRAELAKQTKRK